MTNNHPVILVRDPVAKDYSPLLKYVLEERTIGLSGIDILIDIEIKKYQQLNTVLSQLYNRARKLATEAGYDYTFEINVLFNRSRSLKGWRFIFVFKNESIHYNSELGSTVIEVGTGPHDNVKSNSHSEGKSLYNTTAVGGTFDHLHDGHKILLSLAVFLTKTRMVIGITGPELLKNKKFSETLEPYSKRQESVITFVNILTTKSLRAEHGFRFEIYQINDVCGPTGYLQEIDALIVSEESVKGGQFVNNYRAERGFNPLAIAVIDVIGGDSYSNNENNWKGKLSSTDIRELEAKKLSL